MNECLHCGYKWEGKPEGHEPKRCPDCRTYHWKEHPKVIPNPIYNRTDQPVKQTTEANSW